jgi:Amidohydrolase family
LTADLCEAVLFITQPVENQRIMKHLICAILLLAGLLDASVTLAQSGKPATPKNYEYTNGQWFDGKEFVPATWYVVEGRFTSKKPARVDSTIDLQNKWVVPPMGDAFSINVTESTQPADQLRMYLNEGIFFVQTLGNTQEGRQRTESTVNQATAPDMVFANGPVTCSLGKPSLDVEIAASGLKNIQAIQTRMAEIKLQRKGLGDGYWFMDNKAAVQANWNKIAAQKPGLISIYLLDAEQSGGKEGKGLTPDVAKALIKKAHKADLRVYAHIETIDDIRLAVKLGADGIVGLPCNTWDGQGNPARLELNDADLKKMAKKGTVVVPTLALARANGRPAEAVTQLQKRTLQRMIDAGVTIAAGSNDIQRTTRGEANYWLSLGGFDNTALIRILCEQTPRAIFPDRKIGRIADGYEASFLVLEGNPKQNLMLLNAQRLKVKKGLIIK